MTYQQLLATIIILGGGGGAVAVSDALWADTTFCTQEDSKTGLTCEELQNNPEVDVYYVVNQTHIDDEELFEMAHQNPETVRWNNAGSQFILKYDGPEIPRGKVGAQLGLHNPKNHEEIVDILDGQSWKVVDDPFNPVVKKEKDTHFVEDDNFTP